MSDAKRKVLSYFPEAYAEFWVDAWDDGFIIYSNSLGKILGNGQNSSDAWEDAANNLEEL